MCLQNKRQKETRANVWRLFAEAAGRLMSLKGQTPLGKINGISSALRDGGALCEVQLDTIPEPTTLKGGTTRGANGTQICGRNRRSEQGERLVS